MVQFYTNAHPCAHTNTSVEILIPVIILFKGAIYEIARILRYILIM